MSTSVLSFFLSHIYGDIGISAVFCFVLSKKGRGWALDVLVQDCGFKLVRREKCEGKLLGQKDCWVKVLGQENCEGKGKQGCDEWLAQSCFLHPPPALPMSPSLSLSVANLHRKVYTSCRQALSRDLFQVSIIAAEVKEWRDSTHRGNVCWSAPIPFDASPSHVFSTISWSGGQEENFGDANKNDSFARLRGRLKVSLC